MESRSKTITLDNGIVATMTATTGNDGFTTVTMEVKEMEISIGQSLNHVGGRPKTRP